MSKEHIAKYWESGNGSKDNNETSGVKCLLCPHGCLVSENSSGLCGARTNIKGKMVASSYGSISSIALDPIEKKPLYEFHSGKRILSIGSYGCNFRCPFCQNHSISMEYDKSKMEYAAPEDIIVMAKRSIPAGNIGVAYTYNEPLINFEYLVDCSILTREAGLANVLVTNGYICEEPLLELLPLIDAMNIDIKGGAKGTYNAVGGTQENVLRTVEIASRSCHVEITTLVIPGENEDDVEDIAKWLASINKKIPYHLSRFFPRFKYKDRAPTPPETMYKLRDDASKYLDKVYLGNM